MKHSLEKYAIIFVFFLALFSCTDEKIYVANDLLLVEQKGANLTLTNKSKEDFYLFMVDENTAAVIDWIPTIEGAPTLLARQTLQIPLTDVMGYSTDTRVIHFYFWKAIKEKGELVPGFVYSLSLSVDQ